MTLFSRIWYFFKYLGRKNINGFKAAVINGDTLGLGYLLDYYTQDVLTSIDREGNTPLIWASKEKKGYLAAKLIDLGSEFKDVVIDDKPLIIWAARNGLIALVKALIGAGADIHIKDNKGKTAIQKAISGGHTDIAIKLIKAGSEFQDIVINNEPLIIWAAKNKDIPLIESLINARANVNAKDENGDTVLKLIIKNGISISDINGEEEIFLQLIYYVIPSLIEVGAEFTDITIIKDSLLTFAGKNNDEKLALAILKRMDENSQEAQNFIQTYLSNPENNLFMKTGRFLSQYSSYLLDYVEEVKRNEIIEKLPEPEFNIFKNLFNLSKQIGVKFYNVISIFRDILDIDQCKEFLLKDKIAILELQENNPVAIDCKDIRRFTKMSLITKDGFPTEISTPTEDPNQPITLPSDIVKKLASYYAGYNGPNLQESFKKIRETQQGHSL